MKLSLFASAVRPHLWKELLQSLKGGKYEYEVVFAGFIDEELYKPFMDEYPEFRYIQTEDIKPAQCYEVARRNCKGDLVMWIADDCRFSEGFVDKVYDKFEELKSKTIYLYDGNPQYFPHKIVISCKTNENGMNETMLNHRFFGRNQNTPLMAPLGVMSRTYLEELGGFDRRFICGQYENQCVMMVHSDGGKVYVYEDICVNIDHKNKHGSETNFWNGYNEDREQLQNSWVIGGYVPSPEPFFIPPKNPKEFLEYEKNPSRFWYCPIDNFEVTLNRNDKHEPYTLSYDMLLKKSENRKGQWQ